MTFHKWALTAFATAGIAFAVISMTVLAFHNVRNLFPGAAVLSLFPYLFWLVGWHSAVRLSRDGVTVDNLLVRHVIPWDQLSEIGIGDGLVFKLRDGRKIGSIMYGGSLIGALLGYRNTRKAAARMRTAREHMLAGVQEPPSAMSYHRKIAFSPWPPLAIVAAMEAITALPLLAR